MPYKELIKNPIYFAAFGFGSGFAKFAPGTFGTLLAVPIHLLLFSSLAPIAYAVALLVSFILGVYLCGKTAEFMGVHDHGGIVWDEFVGYWLAVFLVPNTWYFLLLGFLLFRLFDIWKPWPIKWLDKSVSGGFGIMIDDVLAGIYAWLVLQLLVMLLGS